MELEQSHGKGLAIRVIVLVALCGILAWVIVWRLHKDRPISLIGAVVRQDTDPNKATPIADVQITAADGSATAGSKSDSTGFFSITLRSWIRRGEPIILKFRHPDYQPLDLKEYVGSKLYIAHMLPVPHVIPSENDHPEVVVANVLLRYSMKTTTAVNVGSAVKTFQVTNTANVSCKGQHPCSPDGKWKATLDAASLDAGEGNEFLHPRASCIAGPCPFTRIESDGLSEGGRIVSVTARNWSDTATFLVEAEVFHTMVSDVLRESYPVIFGPSLNFTLPADAEGVSIQAEMNGQTIIFPLGPNLFLSWAECNARTNKDQSNVYRCELKPGYRFR
jgi:hypothetical protein